MNLTDFPVDFFEQIPVDFFEQINTTSRGSWELVHQIIIQNLYMTGLPSLMSIKRYCSLTILYFHIVELF